LAELPAPATDGPVKPLPVRKFPQKTKETSLKDELAHLARVEAALKSGNQSRALTLLNEYRSQFSRRQLGLEAEVLTIQAMYESGSVAAAQSRAQRFLEKYPRSPLGARAKQYLRE
jgi:outer membrane protein assembly factor BamD (BamD/ComL family)